MEAVTIIKINIATIVSALLGKKLQWLLLLNNHYHQPFNASSAARYPSSTAYCKYGIHATSVLAI